MRNLLLVCTVLLLLALANLPIGYYTLLRIVVTVTAIIILYKEFQNGFNFWVISFGLIAILFNPLIPVYLNSKNAWLPIDLGTAIIFGIKSLTLKKDQP